MTVASMPSHCCTVGVNAHAHTAVRVRRRRPQSGQRAVQQVRARRLKPCARQQNGGGQRVRYGTRSLPGRCCVGVSDWALRDGAVEGRQWSSWSAQHPGADRSLRVAWT